MSTLLTYNPSASPMNRKWCHLGPNIPQLEEIWLATALLEDGHLSAELLEPGHMGCLLDSRV